jgi:hypothetical protein
LRALLAGPAALARFTALALRTDRTLFARVTFFALLALLAIFASCSNLAPFAPFAFQSAWSAKPYRPQRAAFTALAPFTHRPIRTALAGFATLTGVALITDRTLFTTFTNLATLAHQTSKTTFTNLTTLTRKPALTDRTLFTALALRSRLAVLQFTKPGSNTLFQRRDLGFQLTDERSASRGHQFNVLLPNLLLTIQCLGKQNTPSIKEYVAAVRCAR